MLFEVLPCTLLPPQYSFGKMTFLLPSVWTKGRTHMDSHLKEELTDLFWKLLGIQYPHRQSANDYITALCQWSTLPSYVRDSLHDKYLLFTYFYLMQEKIETWFASLVNREYHGVKLTTFLWKNWQKNCAVVKWTAKHVFFSQV